MTITHSSFYSNRSTFEKVIEKIQMGPDFMEQGVYTVYDETVSPYLPFSI